MIDRVWELVDFAGDFSVQIGVSLYLLNSYDMNNAGKHAVILEFRLLMKEVSIGVVPNERT